MQGTPLRKAHLIGIAGTGMSALATMLYRLGVEVGGSDQDFSPPTGPLLRSLPLTLKQGYRPEHLPLDADLVVVGNAARADNPEVVRAKEAGLPLWSMPATLYALCQERTRIVVAGTHGKSTTTAVIAWLLRELGEEPGWMIGAIPRFGLPGEPGKGAVVMEGDEYSSAFFDRNPKFLHYHPHHLVIPVVEYDHADLYPDLQSIEREFQRLIQGLPRGGVLVLSQESRRFAPYAPPGVQVLSLPDLKFTLIASGPTGVEFELKGRRYSFPFPGKQMATDAALALALVEELGGDPARTRPALASYPGLLRRQEVLLDGGYRILWDFGHHPTEVAFTLEGIRTAHPGVPLFVVFEPRSYTSRTHRFQKEYARVFQEADRLYLAPVYRPEALKDPPLDTGEVARSHREGKAFTRYEELEHTLLSELRSTPPPWVLVFFSNGTLAGIPQRIAEECSRWAHQ